MKKLLLAIECHVTYHTVRKLTWQCLCGYSKSRSSIPIDVIGCHLKGTLERRTWNRNHRNTSLKMSTSTWYIETHFKRGRFVQIKNIFISFFSIHEISTGEKTSCLEHTKKQQQLSDRGLMAMESGKKSLVLRVWGERCSKTVASTEVLYSCYLRNDKG